MTNEYAAPTGLDDAGVLASLDTSEPVLLYFTAEWCGPCIHFGPLVREFKEQHQALVTVLRIDGDAAPRAVERYEVAGFPTLILVRDGRVLWRFAGTMSGPELDDRILPLARAAANLPQRDVEPEHTPATGQGVVPDFDDARVEVTQGQQILAGGSSYDLSAGRLQVRFTSDVRLDPATDLTLLDQFPTGHVGVIDIRTSFLTPSTLDSARRARVNTMMLRSGLPLPTDVIDELAGMPDLQNLMVFAPQVDEAGLRRMLPLTVVNWGWTDPELLAIVGNEAPSSVAPVGTLPTTSVPGGTVTEPTIVVIEQPHDPLSAEVRAALEAISDDNKVERWSPADPGLTKWLDPQPYSQIAIATTSGVIALRSADRAETVAELATLAGDTSPRDGRVQPADRPTRRVEIPELPHGTHAFLAHPQAHNVDWIVLRTRQIIDVPAAWDVILQGTAADIAAIPQDVFTVARLLIRPDHEPGLLEPLGNWIHLHKLVVNALGAPEALPPVLRQLVNLRSLTVMGFMDEQPILDLQTDLAGVLVNESWTATSKPAAR